MARTIRVRAQFIGKDGSLGYEYGKYYTLEINQNLDGTSTAFSADHPPCVYESPFSFISNWNNIIQNLISKDGRNT